MPICKKCGIVTSSKDTVCRKCGAPQEQESTSSSMFPNSTLPTSSELPKSTGFTFSSPLTSETPPTPPPPPAPTPPPTPTFSSPPPPTPPTFSAPPPPTPPVPVEESPPVPVVEPPPVPVVKPPPVPVVEPPPVPVVEPPPISVVQQPPPPAPDPKPTGPKPIPFVRSGQSSSRQKDWSAPSPPSPPKTPTFQHLSRSNREDFNLDDKPTTPLQQLPQTQAARVSPPLVSPPQPIPSEQTPKIDFLVPILAALFLIVCCANPVAIPALILAIISKSQYNDKNYELAAMRIRQAKTTLLIATILTLLFLAFALILPSEEADTNTQNTEQTIPITPGDN